MNKDYGRGHTVWNGKLIYRCTPSDLFGAAEQWLARHFERLAAEFKGKTVIINAETLDFGVGGTYELAFANYKQEFGPPFGYPFVARSFPPAN